LQNQIDSPEALHRVARLSLISSLAGGKSVAFSYGAVVDAMGIEKGLV